ncbi:hypothetical protein CMUS01_06748 [Colletotrichum musicola]|uniref:Uncharacterized protein n=1 Tax=Colletotrichum musicola TaxID=2175873 RepID=A0A8H6NHQ1_9PEZI|nr:hypothetical protein CMUS01_06748 [Colletotrichum musicola]
MSTPHKSELGNHTELNAQGVNRSNEDPGSVATRLDAVEKAIRDLDEVEISQLKEERKDLWARLASANSYNDYLAEKILRLQEQLSQVSRIRSHLDEQDWTYIKNGPSSPRIYSGGSSSSGDGFEG